jgi:hypothetical protein
VYAVVAIITYRGTKFENYVLVTWGIDGRKYYCGQESQVQNGIFSLDFIADVYIAVFLAP